MFIKILLQVLPTLYKTNSLTMQQSNFQALLPSASCCQLNWATQQNTQEQSHRNFDDIITKLLRTYFSETHQPTHDFKNVEGVVYVPLSFPLESNLGPLQAASPGGWRNCPTEASGKHFFSTEPL